MPRSSVRSPPWLPSSRRGRRQYHEIWLDGEVVKSSEPETEPLYREQYLPRKFKNHGGSRRRQLCRRLRARPRHRGDEGSGRLPSRFKPPGGGGLGRTHNKPETFVAVRSALAFVEPGQGRRGRSRVGGAARLRRPHQPAACAPQVHDRRSRARVVPREVQVASRSSSSHRSRLAWKPVERPLGWHEQGDGRCTSASTSRTGRIADVDAVRSRSGLRRIIEELRPQVRLTAQQNVILAGIEQAQRPRVEALMAEHGIATVESIRERFATRWLAPRSHLRPGRGRGGARDAIPCPQAGCAARGAWPREERISFRMSGFPTAARVLIWATSASWAPRWASTT